MGTYLDKLQLYAKISLQFMHNNDIINYHIIYVYYTVILRSAAGLFIYVCYHTCPRFAGVFFMKGEEMILKIVDEELKVIAKGKICCKDTKDFFRNQEEYIKKVTGNYPNYRIDTFYTVDNIISSYRKKSADKIELIWDNAKDEADNPVRVGVDLYKEGFVIATGKKASNFLGGTFDGYIRSIRTSRTGTKMKIGSKEIAKVFSSKKVLINFLKKYKNSLSYFAEENGCQFSVEFHNYLFEDDYKLKKRTEKAKEKESLLDQEFKELLAEINKSEAIAKSPVFEMNPYDEAVRRMKELSIAPTAINKFQRNNTLLCSEANGVLYELDEEGQKAVEDTEKYGIPYHVIKSGIMYAVLYVSNCFDEWGYEVYDKKTDLIFANVWNSKLGSAEMGDIKVRPAAGGVIRYA